MSTGFTFSHLPGGVFDARGVDPSPSFVVPPYDDYIVGAIAQEAEENSKGTGGFLNYTLEIQQSRSGSLQYAKVKIPYRLNIFHNDPATREIGYKQLSAMAHATGRLQLAGPNDLLCNPQTSQGYFIATIGPQKTNEQFSNVYGVKDLQGNTPGKTTTSAVAATPAAPPPQMAPQAAPAPAAQPQWAPPAYQAPAAAAPQQPAWTPGQPAAAAPAPPWQQGAAAPAAAAPAPPWQQGAAAPAAAAPATPPWQR